MGACRQAMRERVGGGNFEQVREALLLPFPLDGEWPVLLGSDRPLAILNHAGGMIYPIMTGH